MTKTALTKSSRGAVAAGATAAGAASFGAMALGAVALGAFAVGALAVGRLTVGRARLRRVEIGELAVGRLDVGAVGPGGKLTAVVRIRSAPGKGDELERVLLGQLARSDPGGVLHRAHRSQTDPDSFVLSESFADEAAFERHAPARRLDAVLQQAVENGLVAASDDPAVEVEIYRAI